MNIGLVLEGGAMRGMYTAGVLDIFLDNNIEFSNIIGVSAGALFGINYLSKQRGRTIRYNKKYAKDKRYMGLTSLITTGNIINKQFSYYEVPFKLDIFDEETYKKSNTNFYATITNVETGKAEYVKIDSPLKQMEVLRATSAMPFVSRLVEIENKSYLDGGIADSIPIDRIKELGCEKIIVILTRPEDYRKSKSNTLLTKIKYNKYPNLVEAINNRYMKYNSSLDKIETLRKSGNVFVFRPSRKINIKRIEREPEVLQKMYDLGIEDGKREMVELKKYLNRFI